MPDKAGAHTDTSGFRIAEEEIGARIAGEIDASAAGTEEDIAVLAGVAGVAGVDAVAPHLEAGLEDVIAVSDRHPVIELNDSIGEVLLYNLVADAAEGSTSAGLWRLAAVEAKVKQAGAGAVGIRDPECRPEITNAGIESASVEKRNPACSESCLVQEGRAEGVGPSSNHVVDWRVSEALTQDEKRLGLRIVLVGL